MNNNKIRYILNLFCVTYDLDDIEEYISYSTSGIKNRSLIIRPSPACDTYLSGKKEIDLRNILFKEWDNVSIPFIFNTIKESHLNIIEEKSGNVIINFDVIAASFYFLSGLYEILYPDYDNYGRFRYESTIQYKLGISRIPVVNYYFDIIKSGLEKLTGRELAFRYYFKKPKAFMTHDVDLINTIWLEDAMWCVRNNKYRKIPGLALRQLKGKYDSSLIKGLRIYETEKNITSTFFFLPQKGSIKSIKCADYNIKSATVRNLLKKVSEDGAEIGLHGSPGTEHNDKILADEYSSFEMTIYGNRFHYLLFNQGTTPEILEKSGIKYDTSLGFAEEIGFRNSICSPFFLYDNKNDKSTQVLEIPLVVMDTTLDRKEYLGIGPDSYNTVRLLVEEVRKHNGVFTFLIHNNYWSEYKHKGYREFYEKIIACLNNKGYDFKTGKEIYELYNSRIG